MKIATDDMVSRRALSRPSRRIICWAYPPPICSVLSLCSPARPFHRIIDDCPTEASQHAETDDRASPRGIRLRTRQENGPDNNGPVASELMISRSAPAASVPVIDLCERCADLENFFYFQSAIPLTSVQAGVISQDFMLKNLPH